MPVIADSFLNSLSAAHPARWSSDGQHDDGMHGSKRVAQDGAAQLCRRVTAMTAWAKCSDDILEGVLNRLDACSCAASALVRFLLSITPSACGPVRMHKFSCILSSIACSRCEPVIRETPAPHFHLILRVRHNTGQHSLPLTTALHCEQVCKGWHRQVLALRRQLTLSDLPPAGGLAAFSIVTDLHLAVPEQTVDPLSRSSLLWNTCRAEQLAGLAHLRRLTLVAQWGDHGYRPTAALITSMLCWLPRLGELTDPEPVHGLCASLLGGRVSPL